MYDIIIRNGRYFNGLGTQSKVCDIGIKGGVVKEISEVINDHANTVIDASDKWVMPGFIDTHTHYDVELLVLPALSESVRHGVTTVVTGNCSLSTVFSTPLDCADMFSRVEALPREPVLSVLTSEKTWETPQGWVRRISESALGPNVASLLGHSDLRAYVMGLGRSVEEKIHPTKAEKDRMVNLLTDALDAGFIGMSSMTNPWDKLDGDRYLSKALPSVYASFDEYAFLNQVLRKRERIVQSAPNLNTKINSLMFFWQSMSLPWRKGLKTYLLSATDVKASPWLSKVLPPITWFLNKFFTSHVRWQAVPAPFEIYADGMEVVIFEEFGAGRAALHLRDELKRNELLKQESYRRAFRKDIEKRFSPRIWHRDFNDAFIVSCPDQALVGLSFGEIANKRGLNSADLFLDLVIEHGPELRWKTLIANHRPKELAKILSHPHVHPGFADSGAHLRNMAFYNFPLHYLKLVNDALRDGQPFMSLERAVCRLTHELADFINVDAGTLMLGDRADIAIVDPVGLDESLSHYHEDLVSELGNVRRMVRRNDRAVLATIIGGKLGYYLGKFSEDFGKRSFGRFLRAGMIDRHAH